MVLRTGGAVQSALLDVLDTFAPGVRGLKSGGIAIGKHLDDWGDNFLATAPIKQPLSVIAEKYGKAGVTDAITRVKRIEGQVDFVNLVAAMYQMQKKYGFTNVSDKKWGGYVKSIGEFMLVSSILQIGMPLIRISIQTRSIKPTSAFVIGRDIAAALEKILGASEIVDAFKTVYKDYDATTFPTGGEIRREYLSVLEPAIPGVRKVLYGGISIGGKLDDWGKSFLKTGLIDRPISDIAKGGTNALIKWLQSVKARRGKGKDEEKPEFINAIAAGYYLQKGKFIGIAKGPQVTAANQLALTLLFMNVVYPTLDLMNSLQVVSTWQQMRAGQVLDAAINDIFGVDVAGPIKNVLG